mgnify:CR=1 FL=1
MELKGKKIVLGITGSIAAYKIPVLVRLLVKEGADLQLVMTPSACDFVTPLTLSTLSRKPVFVDSFNPADGAWNSHVEMGNWADLVLIAPVSANTLGKMAHGIADNLLLTTYLAAKCPVFFAPAMDLDMYRHPTTKANVKTLQSYGNILIAPNEGELASGLCGAGRMEEPEAILRILVQYFKKKKSLRGKKILISAGPTYEAIDPVRFIANHSSGLMGFELAREAAERGAKVILVTGPVKGLQAHPDVERIDVVSADEMYTACVKHFTASCACIMAAAVADFKPASGSHQKIKKKTDAGLTLELVPNKDILAALGKIRKKHQVLVGFALETENEEAHAMQKLKNKKLDLIVLNSLNEKGAGFGHSTNNVSIYNPGGLVKKTGLKTKSDVAADILDQVEIIITQRL